MGLSISRDGIRGRASFLGTWLAAIVLAVAAPSAIGQQAPRSRSTPHSAQERAKLLKESADLKTAAEKQEADHKRDEAAASLSKALTIDRDLFGMSSTQAADTLKLLARLDEHRERWSEAAQAREEVLKICVQQYGKDKWQTDNARRALEHGRSLRQMPASQRQKLRDADEKEDAVNRLWAQRKLRQAVALAQQVVELRKDVLGTKHWQVGNALYQLGSLDMVLGELSQARSAIDEALSIRSKGLPENHPAIGWCLYDLGSVESRSQHHERAIESLEKAVRIWRASLGPNDALVLRALTGLAQAHLAAGDEKAAQPIYEEAIALSRDCPEKSDLFLPRAFYVLVTQGELNIASRHLLALLTQNALLVEALAERTGKADYYKLACRSVERVAQATRPLLRDDHDAIADLANWEASYQREFGDFAAALKSCEEALALRRGNHGKNEVKTAASLNDFGALHLEHGDPAKALSALQEALSLYRKARPQSSKEIAQCLNNLGAAQLRLQNSVEARKSLQDALALCGKNEPANDMSLAVILSNLAGLEESLQEQTAARTHREQALAAIEHYRSTQRRSSRKTPIGRCLYATWRVPGPAVGPDFRWYWNLCDSFRNVLNDTVASLHARLPSDDRGLAASFDELAGYLEGVGARASARIAYEDELSILRRLHPGNQVDFAERLYKLGALQRDLRDYAAARKSEEEALAIQRQTLSKDDPRVAATLHRLGNIQSLLHDETPATKSFGEALTILQKRLRAEDPKIGEVLADLGASQRELRDFPAALTSFQQALAICRKALPQDRSRIAGRLVDLADLQLRQYDFAAARKNYEAVLTILRQTRFTDEEALLAEALYKLGLLGLESGAEVQTAIGRLTEATELNLKEQNSEALQQVEREQLRRTGRLHSSASLLLSAAIATKADWEAIYDRIVRIKGGVTAQQRWIRELRDNSDARTQRLLDDLRRFDQKLTALSLGGEHASDTTASLDLLTIASRVSDGRAETERNLVTRTDYRRFQAKTRIGSKEITAALPKETALVDFIEYWHVGPPAPGSKTPLFEQRLLAFLLRPDRKTVAVVQLGPSTALEKLVDRWRQRCTSPMAATDDGADPGAELREKLWQKLAEHLDGVKVVLISPDGPLHALPWAALPGSRPGKYLIDDYAFAIVPVPQLLPEVLSAPPRPANEQPSLLLAGGIEFGEPGDTVQNQRGKLPRVPLFSPWLSGTESEVNDLEQQFRDTYPSAAGVKKLRKDKATKQAVVSAAPDYRFIHWATHGFFANESQKSNASSTAVASLGDRAALSRDGFVISRDVASRNPGLLSGLVFAGVNRGDRPQEQTILTALEAAELDLHKTDLLVLSACETGRGQIAGGEGVLGLQRAFQLAGAHTVVASLWRVSDEKTHELMREFYRRIWTDKPMSKAEALRQAQLWMINNMEVRGLTLPERPRQSSIYAWAAFVLSGDWR
jgi:CHAT domain-containing protein